MTTGDAFNVNFRHIYGIPSGKDGYPVSRLRAIDNLIEALKAVKGESAYARDMTGLSEDDMDLLMKHYIAEMGKTSRESGIAVKSESPGR